MTNSQKTVLGISIAIYLFFFATITNFFYTQFFFKELRTQEQKYTLFSENAFYYSFYQDLVDSKTFDDVKKTLWQNDRIESPLIIKPIVSFNLAPEVIISLLYKSLRPLLGPISPLNFYLLTVFATNSLIFPLIFLSVLTIFKTKKYFQVGSIVTLLSFLTLNYLTRSYTYPGLRENFALPFLIAFVLLIIEHQNLPKKYANQILFGVAAINLLFWQFSFFTLLPILFVGLVIFRPAIQLKYLGFAILLLLIFRSGSFTHVFEFVQNKISFKPNFDSLIYSCEQAFNPPTIYMLQTLTKKLVLPLYLFSLLFVAYRYYFNNKKISASHVFVILISLFFLVYCLNGNRFFVLFIPFALVVSIYPFTFLSDEYFLIAFLVLGISLIQNSPHLSLNNYRLNYGDKIDLVNWINKSSSKDDVFVGTMQTTSFVRLQTGRKITNHPQYEISSNRKTTKDTYLTYTHTSPEKIHQTLKDLKANYLILDQSSCYNSTSMGCFIEDLYKNQGYDLKSPILFCDADFSGSKLFKEVYVGTSFTVLKVL